MMPIQINIHFVEISKRKCCVVTEERFVGDDNHWLRAMECRAERQFASNVELSPSLYLSLSFSHAFFLSCFNHAVEFLRTPK